jgi:Tfp pilus assembly protein PilE
MMHKNSGFTLTELMMIIGIMAAIAIPQCFRHIETTKAQGVVANVHLIACAMANVFAAHNGQVSTIYTSINGQVAGDMAGPRQALISALFAVSLTRFGKWLSQRLNSIVQVTNGTTP